MASVLNVELLLNTFKTRLKSARRRGLFTNNDTVTATYRDKYLLQLNKTTFHNVQSKAGTFI